MFTVCFSSHFDLKTMSERDVSSRNSVRFANRIEFSIQRNEAMDAHVVDHRSHRERVVHHRHDDRMFANKSQG